MNKFSKFKNQRFIITAFALVAGILGSYFYISSKAATPFASQEAEKGTLKSPATAQSSTDASGGSYVKFGAATPPPPTGGSTIPSNFKLIKSAPKVGDWDAVLIERYKGTITDTPQGIRYWVPGPDNLHGGRVETQLQKSIADEIPSNGGEAIYRWKVMVPSNIVIDPEDSDGYVTMSQQHGNNQAGYTGGTGLTRNGELHARVEGGKRLDSNNYESEIELNLGKFSRDKFHEITMHMRWDESQLDQNPKGFAIYYLDGVKVAERYNIPTMGPQADNVMMRVGWYPGWVGPTGLEMYVQDYEVWVPK